MATYDANVRTAVRVGRGGGEFIFFSQASNRLAVALVHERFRCRIDMRESVTRTTEGRRTLRAGCDGRTGAEFAYQAHF